MSTPTSIQIRLNSDLSVSLVVTCRCFCELDQWFFFLCCILLHFKVSEGFDESVIGSIYENSTKLRTRVYHYACSMSASDITWNKTFIKTREEATNRPIERPKIKKKMRKREGKPDMIAQMSKDRHS